MKIDKISFIGLGLIGGSLAKAIRLYHPNIKIYARASERTIKEAFSLGICENEKPLDIPEIAQSDIIFLCCPVSVNINYLEILKPYLTKEIILTDVGSVKGDIHAAVDRLDMNDIFVGGHPMAGSDRTGLEYSSAELLYGCRYCLTTFDGKSNLKSRALAEFLRPLKVRTKLLHFSEHDRSAAAISHVPHIIAYALCNMVQKSDSTGAMRDMASTGFSDATRIAKSSPDIWQQIVSANKDSIMDIIDEYESELKLFKQALEDSNSNAIFDFFNRAKKYREKFDRD